MIKQPGALLLLSLVLGLLSAWLHPRAVHWQQQMPEGAVSPSQALQLAERACVLWVDARTRAAFEAEQLPEAIHCNEDAWQQGLDAYLQKWQPDCHTIVYCDGSGCQASKKVAERLRNASGFDNIVFLFGDWRACR